MAEEPKAPTTRQSTGTHTRADSDKDKADKEKTATVTNDKGTKVQTRKSVADKMRGFS
jgi:hypothetical protein